MKKQKRNILVNQVLMDVKAPKLFTEQYYKRFEGYEDFLKGEISARHHKALGFLKPEPEERILDIGCGRGEILRRCSQLGCYTVGIDISRTSVKISKIFGDALVADACYLPFRNSVFDGVTFLEVIEHLNIQKSHRCVREIHRILKKNGRLITETITYRPALINHLLNLYARNRYQNLAFVQWKDLGLVQNLFEDKFEIFVIEDQFPVIFSPKSISQSKSTMLIPFTHRLWLAGTKTK